MNCLIPVARVRELCDPLETPPWVLDAIMDGQIQTSLTREEISAAVMAGRLLSDQFGLHCDWDRAAHVARIAYLVGLTGLTAMVVVPAIDDLEAQGLVVWRRGEPRGEGRPHPLLYRLTPVGRQACLGPAFESLRHDYYYFFGREQTQPLPLPEQDA